MHNMAATIKHIREQKGYSQDYMAHKLGIDQSIIPK